MEFIIIIFVVLVASVVVSSSTTKIYSRLNINEDSIDLNRGGEQRITAFYRDKCTFYCSTIDRSINNDYDDDTATAVSSDDEEEFESENIHFEWHVNSKNIGWDQNNCVLDYDDVVKSNHMHTLNVSCKVIDGSMNLSYQFPVIYLDLYTISYMKNNLDFLRNKYEQPFKTFTFGLIICTILTLVVILVAFVLRRKANDVAEHDDSS